MLYPRSVRAGALAVLLSLSPALAHAESLRAALTSAYTNDPDILSALLAVKSTAEGIALAKSEKLPTIAAGGSVNQAFAVGQPYSDPSLSWNASYSQTLFDNLKSDADIEAARALAEASRYGLQSAEENVLLQVVTAYFSVIRDTQLVQLASENDKFFQAQVDSANDRLKIGEGTKIDLSQAQARLAQGTASYQVAIENLQTSQALYQRYVGHKPGTLTPGFKLGSLLPATVDAAVNIAMSDNPNILAAKATIRARQANSDAANALFGPTLSLVAAVGATPFPSPAPAGSSNAPAGKITFNFNVPLYSGGRMGAGVRQANLNEIKSEVDAATARDTVTQAVVTAWGQMTSAKAQITSANSGVSAGQLALSGVEQERDVGQATTLDVLNAQSDLITSQQAQIQATAQSAIAAFTVVSNTGHLTAADLGLDVPIKTGEDYIAKVEDVWAELRKID